MEGAKQHLIVAAYGGGRNPVDLVHRDLKPENIVVLRQQPLSLKILDFGIAKLLDPNDWVQLTVTGMVVGTPMFIAPEQAKGDKEQIGPRTDIYSMGVMLYMMLAGEPPFVDEALGLLLARHIKDPPPPLLERRPELPAAVAQVVHRCLEKDPQQRFGSARELSEAYMQASGVGPEGEDTIYDDALPAGMPTPAADLPPSALTGPESLTPPPILAPTPRKRYSPRHMLVFGLAGGVISLIFLLVALATYFLSA
jgi:serine/threonine protein kinase